MPKLPPVPNTIWINMIYTDGGDLNMHNQLYFTYTGAVSATDLQTLCALVKTAWGTHVAPQVVPTCALEAVFGTDLASQTGAQANDGAAEVFGTGTAPGLTSGAAFVMSNHGATRYRGGHSRNYIPGMPHNGLADANTWTATFQTAMLNAWTAFLNQIILQAPTAMSTLRHVIAHRYEKNPNYPAAPGQPHQPATIPLANPHTEPVTGIVTNPQVGSQRRRNLQTL